MSCGDSNTSLPIGPQGPAGSNGTSGINGLFGGYSSTWLFDTGTANNPSLTTLRINNASPSLATAIYVNTTNSLSISVAPFLASFDNSAFYGWVRLFSEVNSTIFHYYKITAVTTVGAVTTLAVTYIGGNGVFVNTSSLVLSFTPTAVIDLHAIRNSTNYNTSFVITIANNQLVTGAVAVAPTAGKYVAIFEGDAAMAAYPGITSIIFPYRLYNVTGAVAISDDRVVDVSGVTGVVQPKMFCVSDPVMLAAGDSVGLHVDSTYNTSIILGRSTTLIKVG